MSRPAWIRPLSASQSRWFAALVFCAFAIPTAIRFSDYVARAAHHCPISYNEGWNAYYGSWAATGRPLYGAPPFRMAVNYPPISFHIVGALGRALGDLNFAGRALSFAALFWVALCTAFTVRRMSADPWAGAFAALFCIGWFTFFAHASVGVNDPQLLGHALIMTAVALYVAGGGESPFLLAAACVLCCLGGFTKHNLLAFPLAMTLDVLLRSRRKFALWAATAGVTLVILAAITVWVDGPYVIQHILTRRGYQLSRSALFSGYVLIVFLPALVLCAVWCRRHMGQPMVRLLTLALTISIAVGVAFSGGSGTAEGLFYDFIFSVAIIAALVLADVVRQTGPGTLQWCVAFTTMPLVLSAGPLLLGIHAPVPRQEVLDRQDRVYREDLAYLKSKPGPAICFDLLLCYQADKPLSYEPFIAGEMIASGRLDTHRLAVELAGHRYAVIQANGEAFFPPEVMAALQAHYRVDRRSDQATFYTP